jgi:threonine dehydrogenase-like Zn-dependent dehydrogenase
MITRRLPLQDVAEGFRMVMAGKESLKVIIHPNA